MIYLLELEIYSTRFKELQENNSHYSNVYNTLEYAKSEGIKWLTQKTEYFKTIYKYLEGKSIGEMVQDKDIAYSFIVTKIKDLDYVRNFKIPKQQYECQMLYPTHIVHHFKHNGDLEYKTLEYRSSTSDFKYVITRYPRR